MHHDLPVTPLPLLLFDGDRTTEVMAQADGRDLRLDAAAVLAATGWELAPYGLCRGDVCIPERLTDPVPLRALAAALQRPLAVEVLADRAVAILGEAGGRTVRAGDVAPAVTLPDVDGQPVTITGSGRKTAVVAWATWCGCRYELPAWKALAQELAPEGLDVITVALDADPEAVRSWAETAGLPVVVDREHRLCDLFGVVNVPSTVWLDEQDRVVKPPTIAPGDDQFVEFTQVPSDQHHEALRRWVREGVLPAVPGDGPDDERLRTARTERRLAAWLHRHGQLDAAEQHFEAAVARAPLDFTINRASMPLRGQDPFGTEFFTLWEEWQQAGRPGYQATT
ncbi:MAG: Redoxin domain protein [Frankiales bacterium]|nr:Redoxin domain protein [Frankiales bacterium]